MNNNLRIHHILRTETSYPVWKFRHWVQLTSSAITERTAFSKLNNFFYNVIGGVVWATHNQQSVWCINLCLTSSFTPSLSCQYNVPHLSVNVTFLQASLVRLSHQPCRLTAVKYCRIVRSMLAFLVIDNSMIYAPVYHYRLNVLKDDVICLKTTSFVCNDVV